MFISVATFLMYNEDQLPVNESYESMSLKQTYSIT